MRPVFLSTLARAAQLLQKTIRRDSLIIGGFALGAWGIPRMTTDVDLVTQGSAGDIVAFLAEAGIQGTVHYGDPGDSIPWVVDGHCSIDDTQVSFQIMPILQGIRVENAVRLPKLGIRVIGFDDLVRTKLFAGGPQDLLDVARLAQAYPEKRESILSEAVKLSLGENLERFIESLAKRL